MTYSRRKKELPTQMRHRAIAVLYEVVVRRHKRNRKSFLMDLKATLTIRNGKALTSDATIYKAAQDHKVWAQRVTGKYADVAITAAIEALAKTPEQASRLRALIAGIPMENNLPVDPAFRMVGAQMDNRGRLNVHFVNMQLLPTPKVSR